MIPSWPWWIWAIIGLVGLILIILEGAYRLVSQKDVGVNLQLSQKEDQFYQQLHLKEEEYKNQLSIVKAELDQLRKEQNEANMFILLQEVCEIIFRELGKEPTPLGYSTEYIQKEIRIIDELDKLGWYVTQVTDVYGRRSSSAKMELIDKDEFFMPERIKQGASVLMWPQRYVGIEPRFIELSIKRDELQDAITKVRAFMKD